MGGVVRSITRTLRRIVNSDLGQIALHIMTGNAFYAQAITYGVNALAPSPRIANSSVSQNAYSSQLDNRQLMIKQPIISRDIVYGSSKKSGGILFMETTDNDKRLHMIVQVASHEIQSFDTIYFNDEALTLTTINNDSDGLARQRPTSPDKYDKQSDFRGLPLFLIYTRQAVEIKKHLGADTQLADHDLIEQVSKWTTEHRLRGIAYLYIQMDYDADMFPRGVPNISAEIKGKKLFDFRDNSTAFSSNPALCIYDYLTDTRLGLGISRDNIDTASFITMANLCDENVTKAGGGTEKRYTCNGIVYSDIPPMNILDFLLTSCLGVLSYSNGKFTLKGGQFVSPTITLDENDFISQITVQTKQSRRNIFNTVKGVFTSPESEWQPSDYPMVTSTTFVDADQEVIFADVPLPFTTSSITAQRIAKIVLFKNREQILLKAKLNMKGFKLQVGDTVRINNTRLGFTNKIFEVIEWIFDSNPDAIGIRVMLRETSSSAYDWNAEESEFTSNNTTLPRADTVSIPAIVVTDELRIYAETPITVLKVVCSSSQGTTNEFEVEAKNTNETGAEFITLGRSKGNIFELVNAQDGAIYEVRARSINAFNVHSEFITTSHEVIGKTAPPSDVTNFSTNVIGDFVHLNWTPVPDLDLSHYVIRHTSDTSSATFQEGSIVAKKVGKPANSIVLPAQTGTYMIKAIDVINLESVNATKSAIILNRINNDLNVVTTSTQSPNFTAGTLGTDLEIVTRDGTKFLQLIEGILFDDTTGNFDDATGNFDDGGNTSSFNSEGNYDFPVIDLGAIYSSRITISTTFTRFDTATLFDAINGNFDAREGLFDGSYDDNNDINVEHFISVSNDNSTYTDFRSYQLGEYKGRYIKIRTQLQGFVSSVTPAISALSATIDMPDRTVAQEDIASGTASGGKAVTFSPAFKELQGLGISAQSLDQNERYVITNKSATGFTITFFQGSGTGSVVDRTFDFVAKGYGYLESS